MKKLINWDSSELCECGHPRSIHRVEWPAPCWHDWKDRNQTDPTHPDYGCACVGFKPMDNETLKRLADAGFEQTTIDEFLKANLLTPEEIAQMRAELQDADFISPPPEGKAHWDVYRIVATLEALLNPKARQTFGQIHRRRLAAENASLKAAMQNLIDYRDRCGALNFQLEKADDYINEMRRAVDGNKE